MTAAFSSIFPASPSVVIPAVSSHAVLSYGAPRLQVPEADTWQACVLFASATAATLVAGAARRRAMHLPSLPRSSHYRCLGKKNRMTQLAVLMAGLLFIAESQASDVADRSTFQGFLSKYVPSGSDASQSSMSDYDKFITPNFSPVKQGNGPDALSYQNTGAEHDPFPIVDDKPVLHATPQVQGSMAFALAKGDTWISTKDFDPPNIVNREERQAAQKLLANTTHNPISLSGIGIGLLSLATMLGARLWRGLQPATTLASSGNVMEMKAQDSRRPHKVNSGRVGWGQQSSQSALPLALCFAGQEEMAALAEANPDFLGKSISLWDPVGLLDNEQTIGYLPHAEIKHGRVAMAAFLGSRRERGHAASKVVLSASAQPTEVATPRVRFAPSPTGVLHVGGARSALFNYLFAKKYGGQMVLRVEDTDVARSKKDSEANIMRELKWCGITWDEGPDIGGPCGPYRQMERLEAGIYQEQLDRLMARGHVYRCFLTSEDLDEMRQEAERNDQAFQLDSPWASASEEEVKEMLDQGKPFVYRFRVPRNKTIEIEDEVLGEMSWSTDDIGGDFVIVRDTGVPMYNFVVVVDDAQMGITHVLRAQEHLNNTPKQVLLYEALGYDLPRFGHMPLILAPDRTKLSKRYGAVSVGEYERLGYLPSSMVNYLAQLGWNDGTDKEIYATDELIEAFTMERMSKVSAVFDKDKFKWVNGQYIRELSDEEIIRFIGDELVAQEIVKEASSEFVSKAAILLRNRINTLSEATQALQEMLTYPLKETLASDEGARWAKDGSVFETAKLLLQANAAGELDEIGTDPEAMKNVVKQVREARKVKGKPLMMPLRICLTGRCEGPDMSDIFEMMQSIDDNVLCEHVSLSERLNNLAAELGTYLLFTTNFAQTMGNAGGVEIQKKGSFLHVKSEDGTIKRVVRETGDTIPIKQLFVKIDDITSISEKVEDNDCLMTLKNGNEYCLDEVNEPDEIFDVVKNKMIQEDEGFSMEP